MKNKSNLKNITAERVKQLISEKNISGNQLEKILNLSPGTVSAWMLGKYRPGVDAVIKIAKYFNVSCDYLLGVTDKRNHNDESEKEKSESQIEAT